MHTINLIEIDFEGKFYPPKKSDFEFIPRINERVIMNGPNDTPYAYKVLDVHHFPGKQVRVFITLDKTLDSVYKGMINQALTL